LILGKTYSNKKSTITTIVGNIINFINLPHYPLYKTQPQFSRNYYQVAYKNMHIHFFKELLVFYPLKLKKHLIIFTIKILLSLP